MTKKMTKKNIEDTGIRQKFEVSTKSVSIKNDPKGAGI